MKHDENDEKCVRCGHDKFFHKSIFEACGRLEYCHFVECECRGFVKSEREELKEKKPE